MTKLCGCCRQPFAGDPAGYHKSEPVCSGCKDEIVRCGFDVSKHE